MNTKDNLKEAFAGESQANQKYRAFAKAAPGLLLEVSRFTRLAACRLVSNATAGIVITNATGDIIGGGTSGVTVVSGSFLAGIEILNSSNVVVQNTFIGVTSDGLSSVGNGLQGVHLSAGSSNALLTNVICGSTDWVVLIDGGNEATAIHGCRIGLNVAGVAVLSGGNGRGGIRIDAGRRIRIGDETRTNWISGNAYGPGISIRQTAGLFPAAVE